MSHHSQTNNYSRFFNLKQKVFLVNMSEERNSDIYESLSGVVTKSSAASLELLISHNWHGTHDNEVGKATYKLTTEALGGGIQVLADLIGIVSGNIFQFRIHGTMEMFQRRVIPRVQYTTQLYQMSGSFPLEFFRKEWQRITDHLRIHGMLPEIVMQEAEINLSAGGIGIVFDKTKRPTPLSMFFIALSNGVPVCALTETIWEKPLAEGLHCGFRFIHILKTDQERINNCISDMVRKGGGTHLNFRRNWVLVDKMVSDIRKPE